MSIKKSILKNGIAAIMQKVIKVAEQVVLIPFFIKFWGASYYGEWLTLTVVPSILALADFGFGSAAANTFIFKYASGDKQGAADIAKTGFRVLTFLVIGAISLSLLVIFSLHKVNLFDKSVIPANEAITAIILLLISRILNFYQALYEAFFRAARKANLSINIQSLISVINIISGFFVLVFGGKVVLYALISVCVAVIVNPIYIICAKKVLGLHKTHKGSFKKSEIKQLIRTGTGYLLAPIWQAIYFQGSTFVVRLVLGPVAVTIFNTVRTVIRSSSQAFATLITATFPDFQFEFASGNLKKARIIFLGVLGANIVMATLFILGLSFFGDELYSLWTQDTLEVNTDVWLIFISSIIFFAVWYTFSFVFEALNKPFTYTFASLICSLLAIFISWRLSLYYDLKGAALGNLCFDVLMCLYLVPLALKKLCITKKTAFNETIFIMQGLLMRIKGILSK